MTNKRVPVMIFTLHLAAAWIQSASVSRTCAHARVMAAKVQVSTSSESEGLRSFANRHLSVLLGVKL